MSAPNVLSLDFTQLDCVGQCNALLNAYVKGLTGGQRIQVRSGEHWVEYRANRQNDMLALQQLYRIIKGQCPAAANLPDLSPGLRAQRGPAIGVRIP